MLPQMIAGGKLSNILNKMKSLQTKSIDLYDSLPQFATIYCNLNQVDTSMFMAYNQAYSIFKTNLFSRFRFFYIKNSNSPVRLLSHIDQLIVLVTNKYLIYECVVLKFMVTYCTV